MPFKHQHSLSKLGGTLVKDLIRHHIGNEKIKGAKAMLKLNKQKSSSSLIPSYMSGSKDAVIPINTLEEQPIAPISEEDEDEIDDSKINDALTNITKSITLEMPFLILHPDSKLKFSWDLTITILIFYLCFSLPFQLAFLSDDEWNSKFVVNVDIGICKLLHSILLIYNIIKVLMIKNLIITIFIYLYLHTYSF